MVDLPATLAAAAPAAAIDYTSCLPQLKNLIAEEMRTWDVGGLALALVDDQRLIFADGFGEAERDSVFRVGSISKLFNAIAVLQQVERGKLNLDTALPETLLPVNPFPDSPGVTLRQLLCHRSGLPREAPVGGYFDRSGPSLAQTVAGARPSVLATVPGAKTRYSNLAPSVAGYWLEEATGQSFEEYQLAHVLRPLGMERSTWSLARLPHGGLLPARMRVADGRGGWFRRPAPVFDLGTLPAGNLFSTVEDLARFASALLAGGRGLLEPGTWHQMWQPQLTSEPIGYGLGFVVGRFRQHRTLGHNGAVYGFSSSFTVLPESKLGVVVLANEDLVTGVTKRVTEAALSWMLEAKLGETLVEPEVVSQPRLEPFAGEYESQSFWARLEVQDGELTGLISGQLTRFRQRTELSFTGHSRIEEAVPVLFEQDSVGRISGFQYGLQSFKRVADAATGPIPREWGQLLGAYGPDFIPVIVTQRHSHLYAMTENMVDYRLDPAEPPGLGPAAGPLHGRTRRFHPGPAGKGACLPLCRDAVSETIVSPAGEGVPIRGPNRLLLPFEADR